MPWRGSANLVSQTFFVTFTCNPKWKEITDTLLSGQTANDWPELVTRVFNLKLDALLKDIKNGVLGNVIAKIWVIEFQKRGLPDTHILLILDEALKLRTVEDYNSMVSAEIPNPIRDSHFVHGAWAMWSRFSQRTMHGARKVEEKVPTFL
jgi:hypothetical protein